MKKRVLCCEIFSFVLLVLTAVTLVLSFTSEAPLPGTRLAIHFCLLLAAVCSLVYVLSGARKTGSKWFLSFEVLLAVSVFLSIFRAMQLGHNIWGTAIYILAFGAICVLIAARDLGKKKSIGICAFFVLCQVVALVLQSAGNFSLTRTLGVLSCVLMAALLLIMLELKYIDKARRQTPDSPV